MDMFKSLSKKKKEIQDGNKLRKFFDDKEKITTQFKALHGYGSSVSQEERKQFHQKNYRRAFSVCRNALEDYAKRAVISGRGRAKDDDIKRPCEIMEALTRLCQDIPHLVKQNWNHNALSELFTKFLNFNTNQEIRLQCIPFIFVVIDAAKESAHRKYVENLKHAADFTPFCIQVPYENYYSNCKKNLIVAQEPLPWIRTGPIQKGHCVAILSCILEQIRDATDFDFWYLYVNKHIYPQLYYSCTSSNGLLVMKMFAEEEKHELDQPQNVEKEGFGSCGPPPQIQSLFSDWMDVLLMKPHQRKVILSRKIYILYLLEMLHHTMKLPVTRTSTTFAMLKHVERWILGMNISNAFKEENQMYFQMIIQHLFHLFEIENMDLATNKLNRKLNLASFGIFLLRLIASEATVKLSSATWQCLFYGLLKQIKLKLTDKIQHESINERLIHPLIHCLFKSFIFMSIADSKTANLLLTQFKFEVDALLKHRIFLIEWREIMRNMTVELLKLISPKIKEGNSEKVVVPNQDLEMDSDGYYFEIEHRMAQINMDHIEFSGLDEAFMIYDRLLHILGAPVNNIYSKTRALHLEGFCDPLRLFIAALGVKEWGRARRQKEQARRKKETLIKKRPKIVLKDDNPNNIDGALYGLPHSAITVPIDVSDIALSGNIPDTIRESLPLPPREQLPQSDTLCEIFAPWLFEHCLEILLKCTLTQQVERLNEFRMSFGCLSCIFLTHCESIFDDGYLASYYRIIKLSFGPKVSQKIRSIVIHECAKGCIFGKNLNGVNCLIPDFLDTMTKIIGYDAHNKYDMDSISKTKFGEEEVLDALNITLSLICFASHFDDLWINSFPVYSAKDANDNKGDTTFRSIKGKISDLFAYIARNDNLPINIINTVIWGSVLIIYDEVSSSKDVNIISTALRSIVDSTNINKLSMANIATRAIESLSPICNQICAVNSDLIVKNLFEPFLQNTLEYVQKAGDKDLIQRAAICKICTHQIYCCLEWMFRFPPSVLRNDKLLSLYFKVLHQTLCLQAKLPSKRASPSNVVDKHPLTDLVLSAQTSKMMLFHYLGNFPLVHDSGAISSNASDDYRGSQEGNVFLSYDANVLITANDRILAHQAGPEPGVRFLLRDESGKFAWNFTPCSIQAKPTKSGARSSVDEESVADLNDAAASDKLIKLALKPPSSDKRQPPPTSPSPPPPSHDAKTSTFNETLSSITEKHANVYNKKHFQISAFQEDGLKQVLNYVTRELTPPAGKIYKNKNRNKTSAASNHKKGDADAADDNNTTGSFPSGHLSDKSRKKLAKYMDDQKKEEADLYREYQDVRREKIVTMKKLQSELADEQENKQVAALSDRKIREAVTGFDCSRFLLGHFGILTPGPVLGLKDSLFSNVTSDDIESAKSTTRAHNKGSPSHIYQRHARKLAPHQSGSHTITSRHSSFATVHKKRSSGKQYRLDPYLYSLDCNLLAMFGNKDNAFHRRLRLLDQGSFEREKHKIGVVYVGPDQDDQKPILANECGSVSYHKFIENLGWTVDLLQHQGFNGGLNASTTGRYAKYYNTATYEMAFHIATKMPTNYNDPQQTEKKKHIGNDQVNIIWTDHGREYLVDTIHSDFNQVQIVIYPLNNGLFRIKIHKKSSVGYFGPLLNNMIIRQHMLSVLVRITSLYANRTVRYAASVYTRPFVERKKYLDEAICKNSHKSHESILGAFFPYMTSS